MPEPPPPDRCRIVADGLRMLLFDLRHGDDARHARALDNLERMADAFDSPYPQRRRADIPVQSDRTARSPDTAVKSTCRPDADGAAPVGLSSVRGCRAP